MATHNDNSNVIFKREIARLIVAAGECGETDFYAGKRDSTRVAGTMQLEVTRDPDDPSTIWPAMMHDLSDTGVGFWSKRDLPRRTMIYVREFSQDGSGVWLPARVQHRTVGIRGFLVGASFETSTPAQACGSSKAGASPPLPQIVPPGLHRPMR